MLRDDLLLGVRSAVQRAKAEEIPVRQEGLRIRTGGRERVIDVEVTPVKTGVHRADMFVVVFEEHARRGVQAGSDTRSPRNPRRPPDRSRRSRGSSRSSLPRASISSR